MTKKTQPALPKKQPVPAPQKPEQATPDVAVEIGGRTDGPEPTRYGDWEHNGKCVDF